MGRDKRLSMEQLNIYQKLLKITEELKTVEKNLSVPVTKNNSYKAVGERDVLDAVKPLEVKYGVYSYAYDRKVIDSGELVSTRKDYQTGEYHDIKQLYLRLEVTYRFINVNNPNEYIDIKTYGDGIDTGDKATGKAMTYADKYALLKAYKISTGEDPDQEPSDELKKLSTEKATPKQISMLLDNYKGEALTKLLRGNNIEKIEDMSKAKATELIGKIFEIKKRKAQERMYDDALEGIMNEDAGDRI